MIFPQFDGVVECGKAVLKKEKIMPKPQPTFTAELKQQAVQQALLLRSQSLLTSHLHEVNPRP
jgi:hypothetical protein